ncbi:teichuronic acid biosynthesis protein TuaE [Niallia sp. 01092]|uniref:teichuronic acid biosynthesis protein TuaE n=1 Tax=unclassified Niallia TaxID=2837522 RepID=UPI003FD269F1
MESNQTVRQTIGASILLFVIVSFFVTFFQLEIKWLFVFSAVWIAFVVITYMHSVFTTGQQLRGVMYILVAATFLNQSVFSINIGFFNLFFYRFMLIVAVVMYLLYSIKEKRLVKDFEKLPLKGVWLFLCIWFCYGSISILWSKSVMDAVKYMMLLTIGILFMYLVNILFTRISQVLVFYGIWMGMTAVLLVLGLINHFMQIQLPSSSLYGGPSYKLSYPTAVFFNQNDFATFLSISFFFYIAAARNSSSVWIRNVSLILGCVSAYVIYLTESRASLLAIIVGLCVYFFLLLNKKIKKIIGSAAVFGAIAGMLIAVPKVINKMEEWTMLSASYGGTEPLPSNLARINLLKNTFYYVLDSYGIGVGAGNLPYYLEKYPIFPTGNVWQVHNWLAEIIGNFGIFILLGYISIIFYLCFSLYKLYELSNSPTYKMLLEACLTAQIAFLVSSISPSSVSNLYFHWVFLGFVLAAISVLKKRKQKRTREYVLK